jgi:acyl-CoA thioesterase YciA
VLDRLPILLTADAAGEDDPCEPRTVRAPPAASDHTSTTWKVDLCYTDAVPAADNRQPAIRISLLPKDTNPHGTIFGGVILSLIDQAGAIEARLHGAGRVVTVAMEKVVFHAPVYVGDLVSFYGDLVRAGHTSITIQVVVEAAPPGEVPPRRVTEAVITYVNVDSNGRPVPLPASGGPAAATS